MKNNFRVFFGLCLFLLSCEVGRAQVVAPGATLVKLADGFEFTEGPAVDRVGNVYFTDQPNDRIMKWGIDGNLSTFLSPSGRSNGLYFDWEGNLLACADEKNQLWSVDPHAGEGGGSGPPPDAISFKPPQQRTDSLRVRLAQSATSVMACPSKKALVPSALMIREVARIFTPLVAWISMGP